MGHLAALMAENRESPLWEHMCDDHQNQPHKFEMKVSGYQIKPLNRQAEEASKIEEFNGLKYLNRHGERGQNLPPKLSLEENLDPKTGTKRKGFRSMKSIEPLKQQKVLKVLKPTSKMKLKSTITPKKV